VPQPRLAVRAVVIAYLVVYLAAAVPSALLPAPLSQLQAHVRAPLTALRILPGVPIFSGNGDADEKATTLCPLIVGRTDAGTVLVYSCEEPAYQPMARPYEHAVQKMLAQSAGQKRSGDAFAAQAGDAANALLAHHMCLGAPEANEVFVLISRSWVSWELGTRRSELSVEYGWNCRKASPLLLPDANTLLDELPRG
jgi:hypothetical protein